MYHDPKPPNRLRGEARNPRNINQGSNNMPVTESATVRSQEMREHQARGEQQPRNSPAGDTKLGSRSRENNNNSSSRDKMERHPAKPSTHPDQNQAKHDKLGGETEAEWELLDNPNDPVLAEKKKKENEVANKLIDDLSNMFRPSVEGLESWKRMRNR